MTATEKFVVYTVLTGTRERLGSPFPPDCAGFERICFTDDPTLTSRDWSMVLLDAPRFDPARESRRPKLLPHLFLQDFDWSLYIDNTVRLKVDPYELYRRFRAGPALTCFRHPLRDCIYDEGEEVIRLGYDDEWRVREQLDFYRSRGYPPHAGLEAGGVLFRRHLDDDLIAASQHWFELVLRFSKRDQLSFHYVAWRHGLRYSWFPGELTDNELVEWVPGGGRPPAEGEVRRLTG